MRNKVIAYKLIRYDVTPYNVMRYKVVAYNVIHYNVIAYNIIHYKVIVYNIISNEVVTPRGSAEIVFPTVARGPPASQIHPLICLTKNIHGIDERIFVTK
jgi:hypothetical protein